LTTHIPSLSELIEPYQHYPKAIQKALLLVESHPSLTLVLTRSYRRVLRILVSRVPKANGCAPIEQVAADWLAKMAEVSTKTVERALKALTQLGLIKVGDRRDDTGLFVRPTYQLTPELANLLQLPAKSFSRHKTILSDDLIVELDFKKDHPEIHEKKPETRKPIELPPDLAEAGEQLEISPKGIAALRGEACRAGYNLAHIVACARQHMLKVGAKGNRAYRYLQTMIAKPEVDYAGRAAQEGREAEQRDYEHRAITAAKKLAGRAYAGHDGLTYRFLSDGRVEQLDGGLMLGYVSVDQIEQLVDRIGMGMGMTEGAIVPPPAPPVPAASAKQHLASMLSMLKLRRPI
jgi:DNA-binding transcriptional ArsR family regulator